MNETQSTPQDSEQRLAEVHTKWSQLSDDAQEAAFMLYVAEPRTGVGPDYLVAMGIDDEAIDELLTSGMAERKSREEIARDFVEEHRVHAEAIREKNRKEIVSTLTEEERRLLNEFEREDTLANREGESPRFRLTEGVHEFLNPLMENAE